MNAKIKETILTMTEISNFLNGDILFWKKNVLNSIYIHKWIVQFVVTRFGIMNSKIFFTVFTTYNNIKIN